MRRRSARKKRGSHGIDEEERHDRVVSCRLLIQLEEITGRKFQVDISSRDDVRERACSEHVVRCAMVRERVHVRGHFELVGDASSLEDELAGDIHKVRDWTAPQSVAPR